MLVLVTYDVNTEDSAGRRRLRRVAQACLDYGSRVQKSVFECIVGDREMVVLRARLRKEMNARTDSIRIYFIDEAGKRRIEHYGCNEPLDLEGPLIV